jgi:hypothetical protein
LKSQSWKQGTEALPLRFSVFFVVPGKVQPSQKSCPFNGPESDPAAESRDTTASPPTALSLMSAAQVVQPLLFLHHSACKLHFLWAILTTTTTTKKKLS